MAIRQIHRYQPRGPQSLGREINSLAHMQRAIRRGEMKRMPSRSTDDVPYGEYGTAIYLRRDSRPVIYAIATAQAVAIGDAMYQSGSAPNGTAQRAQDLAYPTVIATPNAPTLTDGAVNAGTSISAGANHVKVSLQFPWGEGPASAAAAVASTAHAIIIGVLAAPLPSPALYANIYVETSQGSGVYQFYGTTVSTNFTVTAYGSGAVPAGAASTQLIQAQYTFAQSFLGMSCCEKDAGVAQVVGYPLANQVRVNTAGEYQIDLDTTYTWNEGDYFGPAANAGGTALQTQVFAFIGTYNGIVGGLDRCAVLSATNSGNAATQVTGILMNNTQRPSR